MRRNLTDLERSTLRKPRLHLQSWRQLRQLVKLHGFVDLRDALDAIELEAGLLRKLSHDELAEIINSEDDVNRLARQGTPKK